MDGRWEWAATAIVVAAILDGLDGRMARLLNGTSKFGAELDSLSDFVAFGVAPALVMYMWVLNAWGAIGWMLCLAYAVCMALRLARFNTMLSDPNPPKWQGYFFVGVPAPAGAALALLPLMMHFQAGPGWFDKPAIGGLTMVVVAFLMVSRIPTFSAKKVHIPRGWMVPSLVGVGVRRLVQRALGDAGDFGPDLSGLHPGLGRHASAYARGRTGTRNAGEPHHRDRGTGRAGPAQRRVRLTDGKNGSS
jgi:CDP-diacylglycerol--serine O-phosphatidyltransferase